MVTSGSSRQSSRPCKVAGFAASASRNAAGEKACGISWAWIAIRLTAFSDASEPSRSLTLPEASPKPRERTRSTLTRSPSSAPSLSALAMFNSRPACFLSTGISRPPPPGRAAEDSEHAGPGVVDHLDDAAAIGRAFALVRLLDAQQRAVADAGRRARLRAARNMDADLRRLAAFLLIPFGGRRDQFAVAVASGDVGHHGRRQCGRLVDFLAVLGDRAVDRRVRAGCVSARRGRRSSGRTPARSRGFRHFPDARG